MFRKGTGNSTVSSDALHTVQELEKAQSHAGSAGVGAVRGVGGGVGEISAGSAERGGVCDLTSPLAAPLSVHEGRTGPCNAAS